MSGLCHCLDLRTLIPQRMKGAGELVQVARMSFVQPDTVESKSDISKLRSELLRSLTLGKRSLVRSLCSASNPTYLARSWCGGLCSDDHEHRAAARVARVDKTCNQTVLSGRIEIAYVDLAVFLSGLIKFIALPRSLLVRNRCDHRE